MMTSIPEHSDGGRIDPGLQSDDPHEPLITRSVVGGVHDDKVSMTMSVIFFWEIAWPNSLILVYGSNGYKTVVLCVYIFAVGLVSCRVILLIMSFFGFINIYCLRVNLSVALVDMVNRTEDVVQNNTDEACPDDIGPGNGTVPHRAGTFNWDSNQQGLVLGAFFYGYVCTQVPGGWIAERYGGKWPLGLGILITALLTLLTPAAAHLHIYALVAVRVLEGIGEGVTFPSMHALLSKWSPPYERSKMGTFVYAGAQLGTVIGMPLSGLLCEYGFAGGWPSVFYFFGAMGCVWFIFWALLVFNSPAEHPKISRAEREFLESEIGRHGHATKAPVPWKSVATSVPLWALAVAHFTNNWGYYTLLTCLPTFMKDVLKFDIKKNGALSGLPYVACWIMMTLGGQVADYLRSRHYLSTRNTRKLFNSVGQLLPGMFLIISGFMGCDYVLTVVMVIIAVGCSGISMSGYGVNHLDLAPPFAGTLMGLTNGLASVPGFIGPQVAGALTNNQRTRGQWQKVFYITTIVYCFGTLVFLIFGAGEEQSWSKQAVATAQDPILTSDEEEEENEREDRGLASSAVVNAST